MSGVPVEPTADWRERVRALHAGEIDDDRVRCEWCRHWRAVDKRIAVPPDEPHLPAGRQWVTVMDCYEGAGGQSGIPHRCPRFEWRRDEGGQ